MKLRQLQTLRKIENKLGVRFKNKKLLKKTLTHSSAVALDRIKSNEILEFLGDAVLELAVRDFLIKKFPQKTEGELNELKKRYTSEEVLYKMGKELEIGEMLIMDKGEELTGGRKRRANISSGLEAIFGAVYLDRGFEYAKKYFLKLFLNKKFRLSRDYKSLLNGWVMKNKKDIEYRVIKEQGPPHKRLFYVALYINGRKISEGEGMSKKNAEQNAAGQFLKKINKKL